jgi:hypothetical protein
MTLLELAQSKVPMRKVTANEWHGPCPSCGTKHSNPAFSDRFSVKIKADGEDRWYCRDCGNGDAIAFLMQFEGLSFPAACKTLGKPLPENEEYQAPHFRSPAAETFQPRTVAAPADLWREHAEKFLAWTNQQLIDLGEGPGTPLHYLAGRGINKETAIAQRLGWNPGEKGKDCYRAREAWGLETVMKGDKKKKLWLPIGLVIPFHVGGILRRLRIRIPKERRTAEFSTPYYIVPGSAMDTFVCGENAKAYVITEAELDAILVAQEAAGLSVGTMAMGNDSAKPTDAAHAMLAASLHISNALDYDFCQGSASNPGGVAWLWWKKHFPQAERWPVPAGKDPGDSYQAGINIREWVIAGLPPVLTLPPKEETVVNLPKSVSVDSGVDTPNNNGLPVNECVDKNPEEDPIQVDYLRGKSENGHIFFITDNAESRSKLAEKFPGKAIFTHAEIELLKDCSAEQAEKYIIIKETRGVAAAIFTTAQLAQAEKVSAAP